MLVGAADPRRVALNPPGMHAELEELGQQQRRDTTVML